MSSSGQRNRETPLSRGSARGATLFPILLTAVVLGVYLALPSSSYNGDGLRVFPGLRRVAVDSAGRRSFIPNDWAAGYREPNYFNANVQKHFLFPLYAYVSYAIARRVSGNWDSDHPHPNPLPSRERGSSSDGLLPLQVANAISAALAVLLFMLIAAEQGDSPCGTLREGSHPVPALLAGLGLAFSTAFSSMATDIAEVVPAMPGLILGLGLLLANDERDRQNRRTFGLDLLAGVVFGVSAACYFVSAAVGIVLAVGLAIGRRGRRMETPVDASGRHRNRTGQPVRGRETLTFLLALSVTTAAIYVAVLFAAGYHSFAAIWHQMTFMAEQGSYGGFRLSNLVTVIFGFAQSLLPVLPGDFGGLHKALADAQAGGLVHYAGLVALPLIVASAIAFFVAVFLARGRLSESGRRIVLTGALVFLGALLVSLWWDPYHPKIWMYSNVGLWLGVAGLMKGLTADRAKAGPDETRTQKAEKRNQKSPGFLRSLFSSLTSALISSVLALIIGTNLYALIRRHGPDPKWAVALAISDRVEQGDYPGRRNGETLLPEGSARGASPFRSHPVPVLVMGAWEPEFSYLTLLLPDSSLLCLPDLILQERRNEAAFRAELQRRIAAVTVRGGNVYVLNLFGLDPAELERFYVRRLGFPQFLAITDEWRNLAGEPERFGDSKLYRMSLLDRTTQKAGK